METRDNEQEKKQPTPIVDGDARPDLNIQGDEKTSRHDHPATPRDKKKGATTKNRNDKNSLEDYKDARLE